MNGIPKLWQHDDICFVPGYGAVHRYAPTSRAYVYIHNGKKQYLYSTKRGIFYTTYAEAWKADQEDE